MRGLSLSLLLFAWSAAAQAPALSARDGWIRSAPPVATVRAGYLVIDNPADAEVVLTEAESPDFGAIEIHEMIDDAGTMRMRRVEALRVPAKGKVELKPGGLHLMMFRPQRALAEGAQVEVIFRGTDTTLATTLVVRGE